MHDEQGLSANPLQALFFCVNKIKPNQGDYDHTWIIFAGAE